MVSRQLLISGRGHPNAASNRMSSNCLGQLANTRAFPGINAVAATFKSVALLSSALFNTPVSTHRWHQLVTVLTFLFLHIYHNSALPILRIVFCAIIYRRLRLKGSVEFHSQGHELSRTKVDGISQFAKRVDRERDSTVACRRAK